MSKITHEQARNTLFSGNVPEIIVTRHLKTDELIELDFYITQQEKQDKLLELYKEYYELDRMYVKNNFFLELENLNRRSEIVKQIKELEKWN